MRTHSSRGAVLATAAVLTGLLAGCGAPVGGTPSAADPSTSTPTSAAPTTTGEPTSDPAPAPTPPPATPKSSSGAEAGPVRLLPWPTADPARLQSAVDGGAQPWLLDPGDLAASYVTATYDWTAADTTARPGGTSTKTLVDVRNTDGARRTLTVSQPGRKGRGGIWLVTADAAG